MIPQSETEQILGERLAELGVEVEWNTEFVERLENDTCVVSRIRRADGGEERVVSAWLVSSEGAHSVIRKQAGIEFQGKTYPLAFFLADVELDTDLEHNGNHVWMHPDGAFAALPLPPPRVWRLFVEISSQREKYPGEPTKDSIAELMSERMGLDPRCIQRYLWLSQFRINCRMVRQYRQGRTFLAGDAAHIHSPTGGQGITTCVQDAVNLAWKLARVVHGAPDALLDTYQQERLPHAEEVLRETDRTTTVFFSRNPAVRLLRNWVVLPVLRTRFVQKRMFGKLAQLHVNYRHSPLSRTDAAWRSRPRRQGGDRAPDVALMRANSGESVTLFELLHAARPVALIGADRFDADALSSRAALIEALRMLDIDAYVVSPSSKSRDEATETPLLCDAEGELRRIYRLEGDFFCLIRPDGHLGLVQRPLDVGLLKDYLRMLCAAEAIEAAFGGRPSADFRLPIADFRLQVVDGG
jgi:2-polyprenyl-6-methoxyphenol hydroxylase-like FAD-dependent oxidoreductase